MRMNGRLAVPENAPRFYSVAQVARLLGMSAMTIYRAIDAGEFPAVRIRNRLVIPARAVEALSDAAIVAQGVVDAADFVPTSAAGGAA